MLAEWGNLFVAGFVLVTAFVVVALAVGGVLVAVWLVQEHVRTRRAQPVDWYALSLPPNPLRNNVSTSSQKGYQDIYGSGVVWPENEMQVEEMYTQEELPF